MQKCIILQQGGAVLPGAERGGEETVLPRAGEEEDGERHRRSCRAA